MLDGKNGSQGRARHTQKTSLLGVCVCFVLYLHGEYPTHSNDAEDVEDGGAHDGADPDVTFGDEHSCTAETQTMITTHGKQSGHILGINVWFWCFWGC